MHLSRSVACLVAVGLIQVFFGKSISTVRCWVCKQVSDDTPEQYGGLDNICRPARLPKPEHGMTDFGQSGVPQARSTLQQQQRFITIGKPEYSGTSECVIGGSIKFQFARTLYYKTPVYTPVVALTINPQAVHNTLISQMAPTPQKHRRSLNPSREQSLEPSKHDIVAWVDGLNPGTLRILLKAASERDALVAESVRETVEFPDALDRLVSLNFDHHATRIRKELKADFPSFNEELLAASDLGRSIEESLEIILGQVRIASTYETKFSAANSIFVIASDVFWSKEKSAVASRVWAKCQYRLGDDLKTVLLLLRGDEKKSIVDCDGGQWFHDLTSLVTSAKESVAFENLTSVVRELGWFVDIDDIFTTPRYEDSEQSFSEDGDHYMEGLQEIDEY
ncbi:uncharacterized protein BCR38DRAFT_508091 [Pseudomassariella vexata]|uniref:Uncharacterized protein n=1 Tax=Pseudomassariella vexata TaxID=1141098 RepID=A0A1Y2EBT0_9PEZI|nr:uncharacterized protein BCR38DRAFT_508091 [Pseudomassariella vexata]ORY68877.1 hypothetical protein BCR38DRAFT_508091 [Pseudomassariella vexata]